MAGLFNTFGSALGNTDPAAFSRGAARMAQLQNLQQKQQDAINARRIAQEDRGLDFVDHAGNAPAFALSPLEAMRQIETPAPPAAPAGPTQLAPPATSGAGVVPPPTPGPNVTYDENGDVVSIAPAQTSTSQERLTNPELANTQTSHLTVPSFDPNQTRIDYDIFNNNIMPLADGLATGSYGNYGSGLANRFFGESSPEIDAQRELTSEAVQWYRSDEAGRYFTQNPNIVEQARRDPLGFYQAFKREAPIRSERRVNSASADRTDRLITGRANRMADAIQTPEVQQLIAQAQALGVDPRAAIAIYAIESDFGANTGTSSRGARAGMQVIDSTFRSMKAWFTDAQNIRQYNIPPALTAAARAMQRGDVTSEFNAGLLYLKYNELIGNPMNLWGAGYQASADAVRRLGRPINADDGNITNSDYNRAYIELFNQASTLLGGTAMAGATAAPMSNQQVVDTANAAINRATGQNVPAPAVAPVTSAQSANTGNVAVATDNVSSLQATGQSVPSPAATPTAPTAPIETTPAAPAPVTPMQIAPIGGTPPALQTVMGQRQRIAQHAMLAQRQLAAARVTGNQELIDRYEGRYNELSTMLSQADQAVVVGTGQLALQELQMANNPQRAAAVYSYVTGTNIQIIPRSDGQFDVMSNGTMIGTRTKQQLSNELQLAFDANFRSQTAQRAASRSDQMYESMLKREEEMVRIYGQTRVERLKQQGAILLEQIKQQNGVSVTSLGSGGALVRMGNQMYLFDPLGREYTDMNGDQQIEHSLTPLSASGGNGGGNPYVAALANQ
jgi:hypothetical protein